MRSARWGAKYYASLRAEYGSGKSVAAALVPTCPEDEPYENLLSALSAVVTSKANVPQYIDWADSVTAMNNLNTIAVYRQALNMAATRCVEHTIFGIVSLQLVRRLDLHEAFPEPWAAMREPFDKCLQCSLTR